MKAVIADFSVPPLETEPADKDRLDLAIPLILRM